MRYKFHNVKLKKDTNFITANELLNEVRNKMKSYFETSMIDDSDMYPIIRSCLSAMGAKIYPTSSAVIPINNYKGFLPKDFHKLILALGCSNETIVSTPNTNPQIYDKIITKEQALELTPSEVCLDSCGDYYQVVQKFEAFEVIFNDVYPLSINSTSDYACSKDCWNKTVRGVDEIDIKNGCIYTQFSSGSIYIEYMQNLETQDTDGIDLLIPDYSPIREWIKAACIKEGLEMLYLNGEADVERRLGYAKNELTVKETNAKSFISRPEFSELYDTKRVFYGRYRKFDQMVYGK